MPNDLLKLKRRWVMNAGNSLKKTKPAILRGAQIDASNAFKYAWWFESFRDQLRTGVYRFSYFKIDGEIREARGTLDLSRIPAEHLPNLCQVLRTSGRRITRLSVITTSMPTVGAPSASITSSDLSQRCRKKKKKQKKNLKCFVSCMSVL